MMKMRYYNIAVLLWCMIMISCSDDFGRGHEPDAPEINISADYPMQQMSRASDNGFAHGDVVGVFVIDYDGDTPGEMVLSGNRASNMMLTYDEASNRWDAPATLYWADKETPADFVGYYPFDNNLSSIDAYPVDVQTRQDKTSTETALGGYEASDFLWAKSVKVHPTAEIVVLQYHHLMAGVTVRLEKGTGFTDAEWNEAEKIVRIRNTVIASTIDLSTGVVSLSGSAVEDIVPYRYNESYRAVVVPQEVVAGKALISLTIDGRDYELVKSEAMSYESGKMHTFTIQVEKKSASGDYKFELLDESITAWIDDLDFHDGIVREYLVVNVPTAGTLADCIAAMGKDYEDIVSMKLTGEINGSDFEFMRDNMLNLSSLNLKDVLTENYEIPQVAFGGKKNLRHIILPSKLKRIGYSAFYEAGLIGYLKIPEGVEVIDNYAFERNSLTCQLVLPSTIKEIGNQAFFGSGFCGEFSFPEGLERIGDDDDNGVFGECNLTGTMSLPSSLKYCTFLRLDGLTGEIVIPQVMTEIGYRAFLGSACTSLELHEGVTKIGFDAFAQSKITGEVRIPSACKYIDSNAFSETNITSIILHDNVVLGENVFKDCRRLMGQITIPKCINRIPTGTFQNCSGITELVLHDGVATIGEWAFENCTSLVSILCESEEPPLVCEGAFNGVSKPNVVIEVPASAVHAYKMADGWREFGRIVEYKNFDCRPATACALNQTYSRTLVLNADGPWEVEHKPEWCSVSKSSGTGKTEMVLTINELARGAGNRTDSISFRLTGTEHTTYCKLSQYDYQYAEDEKVVLQSHTKGDAAGVDIIFIGDGFNGEEIASGEYLDLVKEQTEHFFGVEPFKSHREYFNVYAMIGLSQESGINTLNTYRDTRFGTIYGGCNDKLIPESDMIFEYAKTALGHDNFKETLVILVPNTTDYGGNTWLDVYTQSAIAICPPSVQAYPGDTRGVIQHEACGHGFGKLADEMIIKNAFILNNEKNDINDKQRWRGWYQNVSTSGKMSDVPWRDFIFDERYSDYVDIFEGAAGYTRGVYRSEANSCMNYGIPYFNAISRKEIMRRILNYAGESFSMEYFYANDSREWGNGGQSRSLDNGGYVMDGRHKVPMVVKGWKDVGDKARKLREQAKKNMK